MFSLNCKLSLQTQLKSSFYPLLNPITSPGTNPKPAAIGDPEVTIVEECVANCDAVLLSASTTCPSTLDNVVIVAFSISNLIDMQAQLQITQQLLLLLSGLS